VANKHIPLTLAATAERIREAGPEDAWIYVRDFLDDFYAAQHLTREAMIRDEPQRTGEMRMDAYLAALAEHFAYHYGLRTPAWVNQPDRFLDQFWFPTTCKSLQAMALVQSPAAFRRRGIFVDDTELIRC
jgi:hypothetical protein